MLWYGEHVYDDKPHQFWNQMRIAAELLGDKDAAAVFNEYYENGCPFRQELLKLRKRR